MRFSLPRRRRGGTPPAGQLPISIHFVRPKGAALLVHFIPAGDLVTACRRYRLALEPLATAGTGPAERLKGHFAQEDIHWTRAREGATCADCRAPATVEEAGAPTSSEGEGAAALVAESENRHDLPLEIQAVEEHVGAAAERDAANVERPSPARLRRRTALWEGSKAVCDAIDLVVELGGARNAEERPGLQNVERGGFGPDDGEPSHPVKRRGGKSASWGMSLPSRSSFREASYARSSSSSSSGDMSKSSSVSGFSGGIERKSSTARQIAEVSS